MVMWSRTYYGKGRKEGNVLFNDTLNTFYLRLYGVKHMVKYHTDSERGNPLPLHGLIFLIKQQGFFYMHHPTDRITHTMAFVTPVMEHWLEWEIAQWVHPMKDRSDDPSHHERTLLPQSYISLPIMVKDHSTRKKHLQPPILELLFPISSKGSFICTIPQTW